jgi:hypothetical protein
VRLPAPDCNAFALCGRTERVKIGLSKLRLPLLLNIFLAEASHNGSEQAGGRER